MLGSVRRSLDWVEMKYKNFNIETDNCLERKKRGNWRFVFNIYKTKKFLGSQELEISKDVKAILTKWIKLLQDYYPDNDYLLIDTNGGKMNSPKLTQRLNTILNRKASTSILRHSFISDKYSQLPALKKMIADAEANSHSLEQELLYIKR
jgi:integrase